ncbi:hypothetical protein PMIN06_009619 [Paraphaeosphaeria minitans]|uniref:Uncharacterized protein n=1 Tax=Paraphaeosphaeria minitans TaxID=565426 RepID=A0A9P6KTC5_9PLEO|nr:hypothetical protein PMIN01_03981 [Paraphaeosphaeria minitans]
MTSHKKLSLPGKPVYPPKHHSLGLLGKLPVELRLNIFEIVLEIDRPITARKCCGILGYLAKPCRFHAGINEYYHLLDRSRFALLTTSRAVYHDAVWVMHNKIRAYPDVANLMLLQKGATRYGCGSERRQAMWCCISRYRLIELIVPVAAIKFGQSEESVSGLFDCIAVLLDIWHAQTDHTSAQKVREITIHLHRMFSTYRPFKTVKLDDPNIKEEQARLLEECWENLENSVGLVALRGGEANWTFTVSSEIDASNQVGQQMLKMFRECLKEVNIDFQEETAEDTPVMESKSATGGTQAFLRLRPVQP